MTQGFQYGVPGFGDNLESDPIRLNFQALSTSHRGNTPPLNPEPGYLWVDDSDSANWKLKCYVNKPLVGLTWNVFVEHLESNPFSGDVTVLRTLPFFEGSNPPPMVNIDTYDFEDAAKFEKGNVQDIIFRLDKSDIYENGVKFVLRYFMTTPHTGNIQLRLDYRIKDLSEIVNLGTDYMEIITVDTINTDNRIGTLDAVTILAGRILSTTEVIHCRLSRLGNDVLDTHSGDFCLLNIEPHIL